MAKQKIPYAYEIVDSSVLATSSVIGPHTLAIDGTTGNDKKTGTSGDDQFFMHQGGHDVVKGLAGDDYAYFGAAFEGKDKVFGGEGYDRLALDGDYSGLTLAKAVLDGVDSVYMFGNHTYSLTLARDLVAATRGYFEVIGDTDTTKHTTITVDGSDFATADILFYASGGNDTFIGGGGNDFFSVRGGGADVYDGGVGFNRISLFYASNGVTFDLAATGFQTVGATQVQIRNIDDVSGTTGADTLSGNDHANIVYANGGNDRILTLGGDDMVIVGPFGVTPPTKAVIDGGDGIDIVDFSGNGSNTQGIELRLDRARNNTGQGVFTLTNVEGISGTDFSDNVLGNNAANRLFGGDGSDVLGGERGDDILYGDAVWTVDSPNGTDGPQRLNLNLAAAFTDFLSGGDGADQLYGGGGDDHLGGDGGVDILSGGDGNDLFFFGGNDQSDVERDTIVDFLRGDLISVSGVGATARWHIGATVKHAGDITVEYRPSENATYVDMFVDRDAIPDVTMRLLGDHHDLTISDFSFGGGPG